MSLGLLETVFLFLSLPLVFLIIHSRNSKNKRRVGVIVLGDVGRSPRMRQHCLSLAREGFTVEYIAERGRTPHPDLVSNENINLHLVAPWGIPLPRAINLVIKPLVQTLVLVFTCGRYFWGCGSILMQNPPTIPVMGVVWVLCRLYDAKMVIDWHNYGYTILGLNSREKSSIVKVARVFERLFGRLSDDNFCVTNAMSSDLHDNWGIKAFALHDRPSLLTTLTLREKHELFTRLQVQYPVLGAFTRVVGDKAQEVDNRPALIVSSTSWTPDEDFSILLSALVSYDTAWTEEHPNLVCAITGTGPLKSHYEARISELKMEHVSIVTCWLEPEDYPKLLAASDLGVSLHFSSSGLDLPMKVVDMFAAGIPVCARNFACLSELVHHGKNGCVFDDSEQLAKQFLTMFRMFGKKENRHFHILRNGVEHFRKLPWHYHWKQLALPTFDEDFVFEDHEGEDVNGIMRQFMSE